MLFSLPDSFPAFLLALRALYETGEDITPQTVSTELLASDAVSLDKRLELEYEVGLVLYALSVLPLLRSDRQGGTCSKCAGFTPFSNANFREQFQARRWHVSSPASVPC